MFPVAAYSLIAHPLTPSLSLSLSLSSRSVCCKSREPGKVWQMLLNSAAKSLATQQVRSHVVMEKNFAEKTLLQIALQLLTLWTKLYQQLLNYIPTMCVCAPVWHELSVFIAGCWAHGEALPFKTNACTNHCPSFLLLLFLSLPPPWKEDPHCH